MKLQELTASGETTLGATPAAMFGISKDRESLSVLIPALDGDVLYQVVLSDSDLRCLYRADAMRTLQAEGEG